MTSEIRTNNLKSRAGLSTVTLSDTGPIVTGIATFGVNTKIDGGNNVINVGTALTIGHTQGVQFNTQNLHSNGFEVNNINASGIITATSFKGDGSNLTGITGTTINNNADNRIITGSGTANTLNAENNLTFDGHDLDITRSNSSMRLTVSSDVPKINFNANSVSDAARITIEGSGGGGLMTLSTKPSGGSLTERLRITSSGRLGLGTNNPSCELHVSAANPRSRFTSTGNTVNYDIFMGTSSATVGTQSNHDLKIMTNDSERLRITSDGKIGINQTSPGTGLHVSQDWVNNYGSISIEGSNNALVGIGLRSSGTYRASLIYRDGTSGDFVELTTIGSGRPILLKSNNTERLRIDDSGVKVPYGNVLTINKTSPSGNFYQEIIYTAGQKGCLYLENHAYYSAQPPLRINNIDTNNVRAMEDVQFERAGALKGYIRINSQSVTYSTSGSDERLKKNFETWNEEVLPDFKTLSPKLFNWIDDDDGTDKIKGFVAQDNLDKFPEAYNLTTSTDRYYFNPSGMVHYLMKAMQEAAIKIETLEAEVAALKSS